MHIRKLAAVLVVIAGLGLFLGMGPGKESEAGPAPMPQASTKPAAAPAAFEIDSIHSTAIFRVHHLGAGQFYGRFNDVKGSFTFTEGSPEGLAFDVTIDVESIDTNNGSLDGHLKSPDFFNAKEFPTMSFKSDGAKKIGDRTFQVAGVMTIRGIEKKVTAQMEWTGTNDAGRMGHRCGFETTFTIKRSDFDVMYGVANGAVGDETRVIVSLEGVMKKD